MPPASPPPETLRAANVRVGEIVALEQQRSAQRLGQRIGGAVGEIEGRLRMDAFSVAVKSGGGRARLPLVERRDLVFQRRPAIPTRARPRPDHDGLA